MGWLGIPQKRPSPCLYRGLNPQHWSIWSRVLDQPAKNTCQYWQISLPMTLNQQLIALHSGSGQSSGYKGDASVKKKILARKNNNKQVSTISLNSDQSINQGPPKIWQHPCINTRHMKKMWIRLLLFFFSFSFSFRNQSFPFHHLSRTPLRHRTGTESASHPWHRQQRQHAKGSSSPRGE